MSRRNEAFTLVEILIVVIILGILAAIVIPQFTSAADEANVSRRNTDLQAVCAQVELFRIEHGYYPGDDSDDGDGTSYDAAQFVTDLTGETEGLGGKACGPYLQDFPTNPFSTGDGQLVDVDGAGDLAVDGWAWDGAKFTASE